MIDGGAKRLYQSRSRVKGGEGRGAARGRRICLLTTTRIVCKRWATRMDGDQRVAMRTSRPITLILGGTFFLILALRSPVLADGFRNPFHGAAAIAQGNAFAAQADDPTTIFYNPAGMTQLHGVQNSVGVQFVSVNVNYTSPTGVKTQNDRSFPIGLPPPGQFFLTANLKDLGVQALGDLSLGLGFLNLYGFSLKYPENGPFASSVTRAQLPLLDIKPTLAYKVTEDLSVGLGADIFTFGSFIGEGQAERQFVAPPGGPVPAGAQVEINGKGTAAGLNASVLYTVLRAENGKPRLNLAGIWRSQAVVPLNGALLANGGKVADTKSSILLPESYTAGIA